MKQIHWWYSIPQVLVLEFTEATLTFLAYLRLSCSESMPRNYLLLSDWFKYRKNNLLRQYKLEGTRRGEITSKCMLHVSDTNGCSKAA